MSNKEIGGWMAVRNIYSRNIPPLLSHDVLFRLVVLGLEVWDADFALRSWLRMNGATSRRVSTQPPEGATAAYKFHKNVFIALLLERG